MDPHCFIWSVMMVVVAMMASKQVNGGQDPAIIAGQGKENTTTSSTPYSTTTLSFSTTNRFSSTPKVHNKGVGNRTTNPPKTSARVTKYTSRPTIATTKTTTTTSSWRTTTRPTFKTTQRITRTPPFTRPGSSTTPFPIKTFPSTPTPKPRPTVSLVTTHPKVPGTTDSGSHHLSPGLSTLILMCSIVLFHRFNHFHIW